MIISESNQSEVIGVDKDTTIDMTIDDSNKKLLMMILSQGLYSDGIGSLIRELTTNALDSQREAGNNKPIKVSLVKEAGKFVFSVQDEGVGLSPDRIENVFSKYCSSTKRESNDQLGFFGLGSKAPLSYTNSFYIISRYDGIEYKYMMFKGEEGTQLSLLDMNDTDQHNGVTIKVPLKEENDYITFLDKMKRQLAYFEGVFFTTEYDDIPNNFKIIKNDAWKYSEMNQDHNLHMAMDNVYYPLDFEKLGIDAIKIPIAISVSIRDGIVPTPNREQIQYTPQIKTLILNKIKVLAEYLVTKWNAVAPVAADLFTAEKLYNSHGLITLWEDLKEQNVATRKKIEIKLDKKIEKFSTLPMQHVSMPIFPHLPLKRIIETKGDIFYEYERVGTISTWKYSTKMDNGYNKININTTHSILLLREGESLSKTEVDYIKWKGWSLDIVRKTRNRRLGKLKTFNTSTDNYYGLLELRNKPREEWRIMIEEYCQLIKSQQEKWFKYSDITPTQEFLDWRKSKRKNGTRRNLLKEEVTVGIAREKGVYDKDNKPVYDKSVHKIGELSIMKDIPKGMYIYTTTDRVQELYPFFQIGQIMKGKIRGKSSQEYNRINCATFSERNFKKIKKLDIPNWINIDLIFEKKNKVIADFLSEYIIKHYIDSDIYASNAYNHNYFIKFLDTTLRKNFKKLQPINYYAGEKINHITKPILHKLLKLYYDKKWLGTDTLQPLRNVYRYIPNLEFLKGVNIGYVHNYSGDDSKAIEVKISRKLYGIYSIQKFETNKQRDLNQYIESLIKSIAPASVVLPDPDNEWDDKRQEDEESDVQPEDISDINWDDL